MAICASQVAASRNVDDGVVGAGLAVADDEAGDIDGEEARAVQPFGQAEHHQRAGRDERRMQALRQLQAVEHQHHGAAAEPADDAADDRLLGQQDVAISPHDLLPGKQDFDQDDGEEDRERIVDAGLDLERRADARAQPQALGVQQEEHRRGVGRGHHRADQQRLGPGQAERPDRDRRGQRRRDQHADGREQAGRAPARCGRSRAACAGRRRTGSGRAPPSRPYRRAARRRT